MKRKFENAEKLADYWLDKYNDSLRLHKLFNDDYYLLEANKCIDKLKGSIWIKGIRHNCNHKVLVLKEE